ncbi:MAG: hypothetical protein INR69_04570 [Mucilaginibacter polytrichastri]|nr:hypothetical protein [Mucilaginibacter polytrichastri]
MSEDQEKLVTIKTYFNQMEAEIEKGKLEANGINAMLSDNQINALSPIFNQATGGIKLQVLAHEAREAMEILDEKGALPEQE